MTTWPYPRVVAHRGGGSLAPENTLAAIDVGAHYGHKMIEFDVKLSKDKQIFLLHDDTLERTTNGRGIAGDFLWQDLALLDAGGWYSKKFKKEHLPLLTQVIRRCERYGMLANIEIKPTTGTDTETGELVAHVVRLLWQGQVAPLLSSFSQAALLAARITAPELPRGLLLEAWDDDWQRLTQQLACISLHIDYRVLTATRVEQLKAAGLYILVYTVNNPDKARLLLNWGVDTICTDRIDLIGANFC